MTEEVNDGCEKRLTKMEDFKERMERMPDGVISCIYKKITESINKVHDRIDSKVGLRIFLSLIGVLIAISAAGIKYTHSVDKEHGNKFATIEAVEKADKDLKEDIREVKTDVKEIKKDLKDAKKEILDAIRQR